MNTEQIVRQYIEEKENLGSNTGGSGHLSYTGYTVQAIEEPVTSNDGFVLKFSYTVSIETEFTYYPDNPPIEYYHTVSLQTTKEGKIVKVIAHETSSNINFELPDTSG